MFDWFDARESADFGARLAEFLAERMPPSGPGGPKRKAGEALAKVFAQVDRFRHERKLNVYKRAKLGNAFRWKLVDLGYGTDFADEMTQEVMTRLAR